MNKDLLNTHINKYYQAQKADPVRAAEAKEDRAKRIQFYASWNAKRMSSAKQEDLVELFSPLWSMAMWGNKEYQVNQMIADNGLENFRDRLADLLWGSGALAARWDSFRKEVKWVGPGMMSELLGYVRPDDCIIWNKVTISALNFFGFEGLPQQNHQIKGSSYETICGIAKQIRGLMAKQSDSTPDLLEVNFFLWEVSQSGAVSATENPPAVSIEVSQAEDTAKFLHDEVKEKVADIGKWLGFDARIEVVVSPGSRVDTVWEATIGNMGRVIYVFEVQTKGSIDSLILNLLKSKKNPAVQGVVAISDAAQLKKIQAHAADVDGLGNLRCWDYQDVLMTHQRLEAVNQTINALNLVPKGFGG